MSLVISITVLFQSCFLDLPVTNCHIQWPSCVRNWLSRFGPDWGQGYEVSFVTVPGIDERWCQHLSNVWYTLDRNPDMPVVQCDPSPRGSNVLPHPDQAARHPSVDQFIWTMFTRQCLSLSGIKSALSSCKWWMKCVLTRNWGNYLFVSITKLKSRAGETGRFMECRVCSRWMC